MKHIIKLIILCSLLFASCAFSEVQVINGDPDAQGQGQSNNNYNNYSENQSLSSSDSTQESNFSSQNNSLSIPQRVTILERQINSMTKLMSQINNLQQQMQDINGKIEIQKHDLSVLKKQIASQYQDLDQRLSSKKQNASKTNITANTNKNNNQNIALETDNNDNGNSDAASQPVSDTSFTPKKTHHKALSKADIKTDAATDASTSVTDDSTSAAVTIGTTNSEGQQQYEAAFGLLKNKKYTEASTAFQAFIKQHPKSTYAVSSYYWLGQLYLLQGQPNKAVSQFQSIVKKYPNDKKVPDALVQLGLAFYAKGDLTKAKAELLKVQHKYPDSNAAALARKRLRQIKQSGGNESSDNAS